MTTEESDGIKGRTCRERAVLEALRAIERAEGMRGGTAPIVAASAAPGKMALSDVARLAYAAAATYTRLFRAVRLDEGD